MTALDDRWAMAVDMTASVSRSNARRSKNKFEFISAMSYTSQQHKTIMISHHGKNRRVNFQVLNLLRKIDNIRLHRRPLVANVHLLQLTEILKSLHQLLIVSRHHHNVSDALLQILSLVDLVHQLLLPPGLLIRVGRVLDRNKSLARQILASTNDAYLFHHKVRQTFSLRYTNVARVLFAKKNVLFEQIRIGVGVESLQQYRVVDRTSVGRFDDLDRFNGPIAGKYVDEIRQRIGDDIALCDLITRHGSWSSVSGRAVKTSRLAEIFALLFAKC